jgi:hypothetical protein
LVPVIDLHKDSQETEKEDQIPGWDPGICPGFDDVRAWLTETILLPHGHRPIFFTADAEKGLWLVHD